MAQYNTAVELTFNDNDGGAGFRVTPNSLPDIERHHRIFGKWRARWIFIKKFYRGLMIAESMMAKQKTKLWVFKAEIPE